MKWAWAVGRVIRAPILVVTSVLLGLWIPQPDSVALLTTPLVALLVFGAIHGHAISVLQVDNRSKFAIGAILVVIFLSIGFAPVPARFLDGAALVGVLVATIAPPTAGSAIVWTKYGRGDGVATILIVIGSIALAPIVIPALLTLTIGHSVVVDPLKIIRELFLVVVGGAVLSWMIPNDAIDEETLTHISLLIVCVLVYISTATSAIEQVAFVTIAVVSLLAFAFLALAGMVALGTVPFVGRTLAISLFFASGLRNLGIGVAVATALSIDGVVVIVVIFYVAQQLIAPVAAECVREYRWPRSLNV